MEQLGRVYGDALFDVAKEGDKLDVIREQLSQFADAVDGDHEMQVFFFSPYLSTEDKREGLENALSDADEELLNFLKLLVEKHRMPAIFRIRDHFEELWAEEHKRLEVTVRSAVELDDAIVRRVGDEIAKQTGREVDLSSEVDPGIVGGIVLQVGNMVLDASIKAKLDRLRREVAAVR